MNTGFVIGMAICAVLFIVQMKGRSVGFKIACIIEFIACCIIAYFLNIGYWNLLVMPGMAFLMVFISLIIKPYTPEEALLKNNYKQLVPANHYNQIPDGALIGNIPAPGFKQEYDQLLVSTLLAFTSDRAGAQSIFENIYTKIHYPVSETKKSVIMNHIMDSFFEVSRRNKYIARALDYRPEIMMDVFNIWVSQLTVHEQATKEIEKLRGEDELYKYNLYKH